MSAAPEKERCERSWELGAARDGRLLQKDLDSLSRHVAACASCQREERRLQALGRGLRNLPPLLDDLLAARRLRHRLFADVNRWAVGQPIKRRSRRVAWSSAALVFALVALGLGYQVLGKRFSEAKHQMLRSMPRVSNAVPVEVTATAGAVWQKQQVADELRIELTAGELFAKIGPRPAGQRVKILLPDGWIEDLGTTLSVRVENGHTTDVHVLDGRVLLQLRGSEARELSAGQTWALAAGAARKSENQPSTAAQALGAASARGASKRSSASLAAAVAAATSARRSDAHPESPASSAVGRSVREEDELYLHIVVLLRAHQLNEARAAAKDYLARFPNGFRRDEVSVVANH